MDNTEKPFTAVEWCAGYAGIHLGLKRVIPNLRVIAFSEIEAFACANLVSKMEAGLLDAAPIWTNLKTFPCEAFAGKVDLLVAGYPCQPFSHAGKRLGEEDERHLWPHIAEGIRVMRPRFCFFENVEGHITLGLNTVISDLAEMGYAATWGVFSAAEVGAPHQRKRVFILAKLVNCNRDGHSQHNATEEISSGWRAETAVMPRGDDELADNNNKGLQGLWERGGQEGRQEPFGYVGSCCNVWPSRPGEPQHEWEPPRVVVNATQQRNEREQREVCDSERRQGGALPRDFNGAGRSEVELEVGRNFNECPDRLDDAELYRPNNDCGYDEQSRRKELEYPEYNGCYNSQPRFVADGTEGALGEGDEYGETVRAGEPSLYVSCDNRVDELRLLGNGVVPATAARAWEVLYARFFPNTQTDRQ